MLKNVFFLEITVKKHQKIPSRFSTLFLKPAQQIKPLNFPSPCAFAHLRDLRETQQNKSTIKPLNQRSDLTH